MRPLDSLSPRGGILRAARRPAGWRAPGPRPGGIPPDERSALWPAEGEDLCWLAGDWRILQRTDGHRFSLDDLMTAHFASSVVVDRRPARLLDLGCGIGSVLLLLAWRFPDARIVGLEAQPVSAALARRSIAWNAATERCEVRDGDLRDPVALAGEAPFDLITGTPPYFPRGTGLESDRVQRGPCRFEHRGGIEDYARAAAQHLAPGGLFIACGPTTQADRIARAAEDANLTLTRWRDVIPREGKPPLFSVFAMTGASAWRAPLEREPVLVVRDRAGIRTEMLAAVRAAMGMPP